MDAGIAALLGAGVGALGTSIAAVAAGWFQARSLATQAEAQALQAQRQIRFEHLRERREPRSQAYADYIAQLTIMQSLAVGSSAAEPFLGATQELSEEIGKVTSLRARVMVEGPESASRSADKAMRVVLDWFMRLITTGRSITPETRAQLLSLAVAIGPAIEDFSDCARNALDDDGSGYLAP